MRHRSRKELKKAIRDGILENRIPRLLLTLIKLIVAYDVVG